MTKVVAEVGVLTVVVAEPSQEDFASIRHDSIHQEQPTENQAQYDPENDDPSKISIWHALFDDVAPLAISLALSSIATFTLNRTLGAALVGHYLDTVAVNIFTTGVAIYAMFGTCFVIAYSCALDTFVSQSWGRNPKSPEAGQYLQSCIGQVLLFLIPMSCVLLFSEQWLSLILEPVFSSQLGAFLRRCVFFQVFQCLNLVIQRALAAQRKASPSTIAAVVGSVVFIPTTWITIAKAAEEYPSEAVYIMPYLLAIPQFIALVTTFFLCFYYYDEGETIFTTPGVVWSPFSGAGVQYWLKLVSWERIKDFCRLGLPSAAAIIIEWMSIEIIILVGAATIPNPAGLASLNISWITIALAFTFSLATSVSASAFAGNFSGSNQPRLARWYSVEVVQLYNGIQLVIFTFVLTLFSNSWYALFTRDPEVLRLVDISASATLIFISFESWHISISGIPRGIGLQLFCAKVVFISLAVIGLSSAVYFGVYCESVFGVDYRGQRGLLLGCCLGFVVELSVYAWKISTLDWKQIAKVASTKEVEIIKQDDHK